MKNKSKNIPRNSFVVAMNLRNKTQKFKHRAEPRGGDRNVQAEILEEEVGNDDPRLCLGPGCKIVPEHNYCSWECQIAFAKGLGGKQHLPNGLPIRCIKANGTMLEHGHGDHPDYQFPVDADYLGDETEDSEKETHALIYTDGSVALTMYECSYALWSLRDGLVLSGSLWEKKKWKLSDKSLEAILVYAKSKNSM